MSRRRPSMPFAHSPGDLRAMYAGHRGNRVARRYATFWSAVFATGVASGRWVSLEVRGRSSGRLLTFPLGCVMVDGERYLVSMLGEDCTGSRTSAPPGAA